MSPSGEVMYERVSDVASTLVGLIKLKSAVFSANIAKQVSYTLDGF